VYVAAIQGEAPTAKHKDLEWSISCGKGDYDGHESENEQSKKPHYHFQMRIGGKPFIDSAPRACRSPRP
jgi:hypothetical protein